tara:strand:- start:1001 stop:1492 length:492 start_codon:yes stop_codon:yes gene_type:complete
MNNIEKLKKKDIKKEFLTGYKASNSSNNSYCDGNIIRVSSYPNCYNECRKNRVCSAIRYKNDYCQLLSSCNNLRYDEEWQVKRKKKIDKKAFTKFPLKEEVDRRKKKLPFILFILQSVLILFICGILLFHIYKIFKLIYILAPDSIKQKFAKTWLGRLFYYKS